jgi:Polyketide cyclase / dehydrase and lipid transport
MARQLESEVEVQASPERVWEVLTDFAAYPDWNPFIVQAGGRAARQPARPPSGAGPVRRRAPLHHRARRAGPGSRDPAGDVPRPAGPAPAGLHRRVHPGGLPPDEPGPPGPGRGADPHPGDRDRGDVDAAKEAVAAGRRLLEEEGRRPSPCAACRAAGHPRPLALQAPPRQGRPGGGHHRHRPGGGGGGVRGGRRRRRRAAPGPGRRLPRLRPRPPPPLPPHEQRPLPRQHLPLGLEDRTAAPVLRVAGSHPRALWAFAHGMVMLELDHRFPPDADLDRAWQAGIAAFQPA